MRRSSLLVLLGFLSACGGGGSSSDGPAEPFLFRTSEQVPVSIDVQKHGQPVTGAAITLVEVYDPSVSEDDSAEEAQGRVFFEGGSAADGRCETLVSIPTEIDRVDVVVHHAGSTGAWSREVLRRRWGPFAPSARLTVRVDALDTLRVDLEDR